MINNHLKMRSLSIFLSGEYFGRVKTFKFSKAVSDTVSDMINAVYHDKPLIYISVTDGPSVSLVE